MSQTINTSTLYLPRKIVRFTIQQSMLISLTNNWLKVIMDYA